MKNGACTEPGIQSSEKRTLVSARAVPAKAAHRTIRLNNARRPTCLIFLLRSSVFFSVCQSQSGTREDLARPRAVLFGNDETFREIATGGPRRVDAHLGDREVLGIGRRIENGALG